MTPRGRRSLRFACLAVTVLIMCNTITHMFGDVRPFDWLMLVIEVLVLLAILWFEGRELWHRRKLRKRVASIVPFMEKGKQIQENVPESQSELDGKPAVAWMQSVTSWVAETDEFLLSHSRRASFAFMLIGDTNSFGGLVYLPNGYSFPVCGDVRLHYERLYYQLNNLRSIMEKPDVYF